MTNVLIVGAGPTGLTAALSMLDRGLPPPRIIEKRPDPSPFSRAVGLLPWSVKILDRLGVGDRIRAEAMVIDTVRVFRNGRQLAALDLTTLPDPAQRLLSLPQDRTELILGEALAQKGVNVEYGTTLNALDGNGDEPRPVTADIDGTKAEFDEVLGADGARSAVRHGLGIETEGFDLERDWSIADVDLADAHLARNAEMHFSPAGAVFLIAMEPKRIRLVSNTPDALKTLEGGSTNGHPLNIVNVRRAASFRISVRQVARYQKGSVSLAGDAAHTHSPVGGRGMNLVIADADEWARRLADGTLSAYSASRHAAGKKTIEISETGRKNIVDGSPFSRMVGFSLIRAVSTIAPLQKVFLRRFLFS